MIFHFSKEGPHCTFAYPMNACLGLLKGWKRKQNSFKSSDGTLFTSLRWEAPILQITSFFFVDSYVALETWFSMLLRQEQVWLKWFFCLENMVDPLVWPAFNFGRGGMGGEKKNFKRIPFSWEKEAKMPYAAPSDFMAFYILHSVAPFMFSKNINNSVPLTQDGYSDVTLRCNVRL